MSHWCTSFIQSLISDMAEANNVPISHYKGCSESDLQYLMAAQRVSHLPELYRQFMLHMGNGCATHLGDMFWTYPELLDVEQQLGLELSSLFVIMWHNVHQTTVIGFDKASDADDPSLLYWNEDFEEFELKPYVVTPLSAFLVNFFAPE